MIASPSDGDSLLKLGDAKDARNDQEDDTAAVEVDAKDAFFFSFLYEIQRKITIPNKIKSPIIDKDHEFL